MKIKITQEHIDRGVACKVEQCAIALAIQDQCPTFRGRASSDRIKLRCLLTDAYYEVPLSQQVQDWILVHDCWKVDPSRKMGVPLPFEFELDLPSNVSEPVRSVRGCNDKQVTALLT